MLTILPLLCDKMSLVALSSTFNIVSYGMEWRHDNTGKFCEIFIFYVLKRAVCTSYTRQHCLASICRQTDAPLLRVPSFQYIRIPACTVYTLFSIFHIKSGRKVSRVCLTSLDICECMYAWEKTYSYICVHAEAINCWRQTKTSLCHHRNSLLNRIQSGRGRQNRTFTLFLLPFDSEKSFFKLKVFLVFCVFFIHPRLLFSTVFWVRK